MCTEETTFVIDHEFAFYGPMGFDVGAFLGNILLAYFAQDGYEGDRESQKLCLLQCVVETWIVFEQRFTQLWNEKGVADGTAGVTPEMVYGAQCAGGAEALKAYQRRFLGDVLEDALGFAGAKMTRRIVGIAHVADLESIEDKDKRAERETLALMCARRLVLEGKTLTNIEDVAQLANDINNGNA